MTPRPELDIESGSATLAQEPMGGAPDVRIVSGLVRGYQGWIDSRSAGVDRHLPIAFVPVIIGFGTPMLIRDITMPHEAAAAHTTFVAGMCESTTISQSTAGGRGVQVDFTPVAARRFLGVPMHELANRVVDLEDIFGAAVQELVEQLQLAPTWGRCFELIDAFIVPRLLGAAPASPGVVYAWQRLTRTHGSASIGPLIEELGWSRKHLVEKFREHVGLPPKTVARIMRFNHALGLLRTCKRWADVAHSAGYYDQAHMIRDFREFSGLTPTEYVRTFSDGAALASF
jgi:AraC-like DNA-binding protein